MTRHPPLPRFRLAIICCALMLAARSAPAKDLGVRGAVWPIAEPDLLERIEARLGALKASGELARMRREALDRGRERIEAPGASRASGPRVSVAPGCSILRSRSSGTSGRTTGP